MSLDPQSFGSPVFRRRSFLKALVLSAIALFRPGGHGAAVAQSPGPLKTYLPQLYPSDASDLFMVRNVDVPNFASSNHHPGIERLLTVMGSKGTKFYRRSGSDTLSGPDGLIGRDDVVLIKINAQWKYRGCTNSDVLRGLIQRILDHPDGFVGEVVLFESGQGRGSLTSDQTVRLQRRFGPRERRE